jgi:hypothetical protein
VERRADRVDAGGRIVRPLQERQRQDRWNRGNRSCPAEAALLEQLGPGARAAGAAVPEPLRVSTGGGRSALYETAVDGRTAAALIGETPALAPSVTARLAEWLENWNLDTRSDEPLSIDWLEDQVVAPARALAPHLSDGRGYSEWLGAKCRSCAGRTIPFVATHNDLTMVNVFVTSSGGIGLVDWEDARARDLPLLDFYYAAADAAAAAKRYADRAAAFRTLFVEAAPGSVVRDLESRLVRALDLDPEIVELAFHACWIRHAIAEQASNAPSKARPFLEILRMAAAAAG